MAKAVFQRALKKGLSVLGEPATLNGLACGPVNLQQGEVMVAGIRTNADDNPLVTRDIASFDPTVTIVPGMVLVHPDGAFKIDALLDSNPYRKRYVVMPIIL